MLLIDSHLHVNKNAHNSIMDTVKSRDDRGTYQTKDFNAWAEGMTDKGTQAGPLGEILI